MENLTKYQAVEIALMLSDWCIDNGDCITCPFHTKKGCMLSDKDDVVLPRNWKVRAIDLFR